MGDKLPDVWATRDFPILKAATLYADQGLAPDFDELAKQTGLSTGDVARGIAALQRRGLVQVETNLAGTGWITDVSGEAYLITGLHPDGDGALEALASMFRQAAEQTSDPDEKSRLRKAASAVGDVIGQVGAGVMTAYIARMAGIG